MSIAGWKGTVEVLGSIVTSGALIVGGVGAYLRFFKGRVFHTRLALILTHSWMKQGGTLYLVLSVTAQNTGTSNVTLLQSEDGEHFLEVFGCESVPDMDKSEICRWERLQSLTPFKEEDNIEAGESICEEYLIIVPNGKHVAFKIVFDVRARKNPLRRLTRRDRDYHRWKCEKVISTFKEK